MGFPTGFYNKRNDEIVSNFVPILQECCQDIVNFLEPWADSLGEKHNEDLEKQRKELKVSKRSTV
jgi:hypothetical protein